MAVPMDRQVSPRDHYEGLYRTELALEAEWLRYGSHEKANSIELLLNRNGIRPRTILELGCGTGAVISECQRRGLASEFTAIDCSYEAIKHLRSRSAGIRSIVADIADPAFELDQTFDVVVLSHVLEHLQQPLDVLRRIVNTVRFRHLIAEVPLENLLFLRLMGAFRDRTCNPAGHVQFFTETSFQESTLRRRLGTSGHKAICAHAVRCHGEAGLPQGQPITPSRLHKTGHGLVHATALEASLGASILCPLCRTLHAGEGSFHFGLGQTFMQEGILR